MANPIGLAITAIAGGACLIYKYWEPISGFFADLWSGVKTKVSAVWTWLKSSFSWNPISMISSAWSGISTALSSPLEAGKTAIKAVWDGIKSIFKGSWMPEIDTSGLPSAVDALTGIVKKGWDVLSGIFGSIIAGATALGETVTLVWQCLISIKLRQACQVLEKWSRSIHRIPLTSQFPVILGKTKKISCAWFLQIMSVINYLSKKGFSMTEVMMILGSFEFKIATAAFQSLNRRHSQNKAVLKRIGRKSASQHIGTELGSIKLNGVILPHWNGGWGQMDRLRAMADSGNPYILIDGFGKNWGLWEITDVVEKNSGYFNGAPLQIDFDVTLQEYGEDAGSGIDLLSLGLSIASRLL